jgi:hypothetical protein
MRRMSVSVAGMLEAGKEPVVESSIVKDLGTVWEQELPSPRCGTLRRSSSRCPAIVRRSPSAWPLRTKVAPKLTIQGGTTEVLRGIIARGLGLR